ncbi:FAD-binding protein [Nitratidesulfovibrio termitidis]|uniref:FAD-binding protein n=1 Tax=Nitratidesulfovibrio termitidis TaxID=42252 RepID=UPI00041AC25E|nr:FAD-binding protein [Nitratidesulfovibrio termitidis]
MSLEADVLVAGAGFAGLRAAIAAAVSGRGLRVIVLAPHEGPGGSSFAGHAGSLGVLAPADDEERDALLERALAIAHPGTADPALVRLLLEQGEARLRELEQWGVPLATGQGGARLRRSACFFPEMAVAAVLPDCTAAHAAMLRVAVAAGVEVLPGFTLAALGVEGGPPGSALCLDPVGNVLPVRARSVVLAVGGPASLFACDASGAGQAGTGQTGTGLGFARDCGARIGNASFLQFLWYEGGQPFPFLSERAHELEAAGLDGVPVALPRELRPHVASRATHAPWGWGLPDAALDAWLLARMTPAGVVPVRYHGEREPRLLSLMAQAGNGGALIDADGRTSVAGLFACGECATGMHGANRIGGAMVLATQVFGHRAGIAAALHAHSALLPPPPTAPEAAEHQSARHPLRLREAMQRHCLPGIPGEALQAARPGATGAAGAERQRQELELFVERLKALLLLPAVDLLDRARVLSCLTVAEHRLRRLRAEREAMAQPPLA